MKHALFVSFQYPPDASSSGVLRTLKYTRFLGEHGWRITVLSPLASAYGSVDADSIADIPPNVHVVRTRYLNTQKHLSLRGRYLALAALPDRFIGWLPWALAAGRRIARGDPVDLIYSTSPPATAHLIAWRLSRHLRKPWVADFRDPWFEDIPEAGAPAGAVFRTIDRKLEALVVGAAGHVVSTTEDLRGMLLARYPTLPRSKFSVIENGYDEGDFAHLPTVNRQPTDRLTLVHAGNINPHYRDPVPLLAALQRAAAEGGLDPRRIRMRFLGGGEYAGSRALREAIIANGLADSVEIVDRMPYAQGLAELAAADVLVLLQASEDTRGLVPAKLYEYLRLGKPVLALTLPGEASELLARTGGGLGIDPADVDRLSSALTRLYQEWRNGTLSTSRPTPAIVRRYERRALAGDLAAIFAKFAPAGV